MSPFLTDEQRSEYKRLHKKSKEKRFADRIKSILALDRGHGFEEIAEWLMIDDTSVRRWHEQFIDLCSMQSFLTDELEQKHRQRKLKIRRWRRQTASR